MIEIRRTPPKISPTPRKARGFGRSRRNSILYKKANSIVAPRTGDIALAGASFSALSQRTHPRNAPGTAEMRTKRIPCQSIRRGTSGRRKGITNAIPMTPVEERINSNIIGGNPAVSASLEGTVSATPHRIPVRKAKKGPACALRTDPNPRSIKK